MSIAVGQYGSKIYAYTAYDMSSYHSLSMSLVAPNGTVLSKVPTLGASSITPTGSTVAWPANTYVYYSLVEGDISMAGTWAVRVTYVDIVQTLEGEYANFTVTE